MIPTLLALACAVSVHAKIVTKTVEYKQGDTTLEGYLAYDDSISGKRPGVLVVHQWLGLTDYEKHRAEMLAQLGYVAFCADIYGKDSPSERRAAKPARWPANTKPTGSFCAPASTPGWTRWRKMSSWTRRASPPSAIVSAARRCSNSPRSGADIDGVVSFHGGLDSPTPADGKNIKCKVLVLAGADDPFQKPEDLDRV